MTALTRQNRSITVTLCYTHHMQTKAPTLKQLGINHPIIQAPMAGGPTTPELVAAISNAGGLGSLGAGYLSAEQIRNDIKRIKELTDKPFAVNLFIPEPHQATTTQIEHACQRIQHACHELNLGINPPTPPYAQSFDEQLAAVMSAQAPIFSFTFGLLPTDALKKLKQAKTLILGTATTATEATALADNGVDMIVAQGAEAGGHRGTFLGSPLEAITPIATLVSQIKQQCNLPVIAAGGIMDGQAIAQLLQCGANAAQLGTAFLSCPEAGTDPAYKQLLLAQTGDNTTLTRAFSGKYARGISNTFTARMQEYDQDIVDYPIQNALTGIMRKTAKQQGNTEFMSLWAGQAVAQSRSISATVLMQQLIEEMNAASN